MRSGEFHQTQRVLKDGDGYCCLGVACHLAMVNDWPLASDEREEVKTCLNEGGTNLPGPVRNLLGLRDSVGAFYAPDIVGECNGLAERNDHGQSFEKIADLIESRPPGLFVDPYPDDARFDQHGDPVSDIY